jgi:general secretion pathway protein K
MTERPSRDGFVMVAVLGILVLFAGLLGALTLMVRAGVDSARIGIDALEADALARAGVELAGYQLFVLRMPSSELNGQQIRLDSGTVTIAATGETGRVDLNHADPTLLAGIYRVAGLKSMTPDAFAMRIADWRDADEELRSGGAESGDYEAAGLPWRPQNDEFRSIDELQYVLGMKASDVAALAPLVTVANAGGTVNLYEAPEPVLRAIPGVTAATAARIVRLRADRRPETAERLTALVGEQQALVSTDAGTSARLTLDVRPERAPARRVEAVVVADGTGKAPYRVVSWRRL